MRRRFLPTLASSLALVAGTLATPALFASSARASGPLLQVTSVGAYHDVVVDSAHHSLYLLTSEAGGHLRCSGACLANWPAVLVTNSESASTSMGITGKIGYVRRSSTERQVTLNGYPLYRFAGDKAPGQANGVGISAFGGTWLLVHAAATTPATTPYQMAASGPSVNSVTVEGHPHVLVNSSGRTLYLLTGEKGGRYSLCLSACLNIWPPFEVSALHEHVTLGAGVKGHIGYVVVQGAFAYVTFNGYPLYTFAGDTKAGTMNGEGIRAKGAAGVWYAVNASATTAASTALTTSTPTSSTTTTAYGY